MVARSSHCYRLGFESRGRPRDFSRRARTDIGIRSAEIFFCLGSLHTSPCVSRGFGGRRRAGTGIPKVFLTQTTTSDASHAPPTKTTPQTHKTNAPSPLNAEAPASTRSRATFLSLNNSLPESRLPSTTPFSSSSSLPRCRTEPEGSTQQHCSAVDTLARRRFY